MTILVFVLRLINLIAAAIVMGGQTYVFRAVMPVKRRLDTRKSVELHNALLGHPSDHYLKPSGLVSLLSALAIVILSLSGYHPLPLHSVLFMCLGMLGTFVIAVLSRYFNVPTNADMLTWDLDNIPANYPQVRARWDLVHTGRVTCGTTAFVSYLIGALTA